MFLFFELQTFGLHQKQIDENDSYQLTDSANVENETGA